jgi:ABC-type nickel/cobalt efflux system permease component RcnA
MFKELYYWMYSYVKTIKSNDTPATSSYFLISLLQGFNILTFAVIIIYLLKINTSSVKNTTTYLGISLGIVLYIINYFLLYAQRKSIIEKYEAIPPERKTKGKIYFWLYVLL